MSIIRYIIVFLLPVFLIVQLCNAQAGHPGNEIKPLSSLKLISENDEGLSLLYYSGTGRFETLEPAEGSFVRLMLPDHAFSSNPGKPQLPVLTRLIDYDRIKNTGIRITNVVSTRISLKEYGDAGRIYPCQPGRPKTELTQDHPLLIDKSVYNAGEAFITDTVSVRKIGIMRGKSLGALEINPVTYHPAEEYVDIIVSMNIFIEYAQEKHGHSALKGSEEYYFNQLLSKGLINYRSDDVIPAFSSGPTGMIIVSDTSLKNDLRPLVEWKTRKGFSVTELYIGENGLERDFYDIKDSLTAIYNSSTENKPAPAYLLLAGDLNYIPASGGTSYLTDLYYAEFDGNGDYIPDMFTGRLPARNKSQLRAMVQKIIEYESFLFGDSISHFRKAVALTGLDEGHVRYMDGQVNYAAGYFNINPYPTEAYVFNHESNDSIRGVRYDSLKLMMKAGVGYINYTGHGSATAWQDTGIDHTFITGMSNKSRYPLVISNACLTANFSNSNNLGSVMVRSADKGALAFIGCTNDSYWLEDYYWSVGVGPLLSNPEYDETGLGFYDRLFHLKGEKPSDWYTTSGQILYAGNLAVASSTSPRVQYYWENYVLLGDPSLSPFIGAPEAITASVPDSLPPGLKTLNISTSAFAYAGLSHFDTLWDAGHASPSGSISLDIPGVEKDSCLLIISGQNGEPFIRTLYFAESDTAWMNINDVDISDLTGNDNGLADYNETIALKVSMQNAGNEDADNAYLIISSGSGYLEIINDSLFIGNIAANTEAMATGFEILIADSIPDLKIATINIELHHNGNILSYDTDISLHAPELMIINCMTDDSETGNGNGLPEADERVKLIFRVTNNGSSSCSGSLLISNISGYISFDATLLPVGQVKPGEVTEISVFADIDVNTPESTEIAFDTELQCLPYIARKTLSIIAGRLTEDFELLNFTTFPWINNTAKPWIITDEASRSNTYSARSGHISHNEKSELAMLLNLPEDDTLRFWYRVSSETSWDSLVFMSGDHVLLSESGEINWTQALIPLNKGVHLLKWIYAKDQSVSLGSDCAYIDLIRFPALSFVQSAISLNRIISPIKGENHSDEVLSLELSNLGRDTVDIISLTYIVNESSPVNESFSTDLKPGDTITLSFAETIDMSVENTYDISVYVSEPDNYFINDTLKITIISTDIENPDLSGKAFTISPNPVRDNIRIICHRNSQDNLLSLYNSSGMIIYREEIDQLSPGQQLFLYPGQLAKGSYILVIRNNQKKYFFKILKL